MTSTRPADPLGGALGEGSAVAGALGDGAALGTRGGEAVAGASVAVGAGVEATDGVADAVGLFEGAAADALADWDAGGAMGLDVGLAGEPHATRSAANEIVTRFRVRRRRPTPAF